MKIITSFLAASAFAVEWEELAANFDLNDKEDSIIGFARGKERYFGPDDEGSSGKGDPHFHILGQSSSQPDICFDFNGEPETDMVLIDDEITGFKVTGNLFRPREDKNEIYFRSLQIITPHQTEFFVSAKYWNVHSNLRFNPSYTWQSNSLAYADMIFGDVDELNTGRRLTVTIVGGPTFEVSTGEKHENVNFKLLDHSLLSQQTHGVIGRFLPTDSYTVFDNADETGNVTFQGQSMNVTYRHQGHYKNCWTVNTKDAKKLIENTSK